jgi:hypothetical protein
MEIPLSVMSYTLTISQEDDYLHAIVTGANTKENVMSYLQTLQRECLVRNCFRVLIEERLEGPRLRTMDVYQIASEGGRPRMTVREIAYVDMNAEGDLMKFAETVAANRGLPVRVFQSVDEARTWLQRER